MTTTRDSFGATQDGTAVDVFTIGNSTGYAIRCMSYGATLVSVKAPDRAGVVQEITLGYDRLEDYLAGHPFFGSSVGRVCNRIGGARFTLDGREFVLPANEGPNLLHGGAGGFHVRVWEAERFASDRRAGVIFHRTSPAGEEGFPGTLDVTITMSLTEDNEIDLEYRAQTNAPTPVNLTNHAYWNLAGAPDLTGRRAEGPGGAIGQHRLTIPVHHRIEVDEASIPTGRVVPVAGTPYDFTQPAAIGARIDAVPGGYDVCYVRSDGEPQSGTASAQDDGETIAVVEDPASGRRMEVTTTLPGVQFYSGNKLEGWKSRGNEPYHIHDALCLETQYHIDAVSHAAFPSIILKPDAVFEHRTTYRLGCTD